MRGKRAKEIRQMVYGDMSLKNRKYYRLNNGMIVTDRLRTEYQKAKKEKGEFK